MNHYEDGLYVFRIIKQGWVETKENKLPMLVFDGYPTHKITKTPEGDDQLEQVYEDPQRPERTLRIVVDSTNDNMMDFAMKKLRYAGFNGDSFVDLNLINADIRAICKEGEFKGKPTEDWDFALPPLERMEANNLDPQINRKLDTLFGKRLKDGKSKQAEPQPEETVPVPVSDDEVPF